MNQQYKNAALAALKGNWAPSVVAAIVVYAVVNVVMGASFASTFASQGGMSMNGEVIFGCLGVTYLGLFLLFMPISLGFTYSFNQIFTDGDRNVVSNVFRNGFTGYFRNVWGMFLTFVFTLLWSLLLVIPGIIKMYSYALTPYILKDYPELSANQAINLSRKMMKGHKLDLFILQLSFIGWLILAALTAGIGSLWLTPYMLTTQAAFYQDVKNKYITQ